jgi:uncharacterized protein DUF3995
LAACLIGLLYAAISVYWGVGGTWLVDTIGGSLARLGRERNAAVITAVWAAAVLKLTAAILPLLVVAELSSPRVNRAARLLAWIAAAILTAYGAVLTTSGLLVQTNIIHASATADHRALEWHAYLWDPWFLVWGLLIATALLRSRARSPSSGARSS